MSLTKQLFQKLFLNLYKLAFIENLYRMQSILFYQKEQSSFKLKKRVEQEASQKTREACNRVRCAQS